MIGARAEYQRVYVIEQLAKYDYHDTDNKTYKELVYQLARLRALEVKAESSHNTWF